MACPNVNSPQWKALVEAIGVREAYREFAKYGDIPNAGAYPQTFKGTNATLKVIGVLSTSKLNRNGEVFYPLQEMYTAYYASNKAKFYEKLSKYGISATQMQLLKAWNEANNPQSLNDMIAGIASEMSYTIDVTEATERTQQQLTNYGDFNDETFTTAEGTYVMDFDLQDQARYRLNGKPVSEEQYLNAAKNNTLLSPTNYYATLTVPGGTNYRENEIRTPEIIPSIKGHAQFSTDNGIGWFRSDDKPLIKSDRNFYEMYKKETGVDGQYEDIVYTKEFKDWVANKQDEANTKESAQLKTRRILELQSDLFQKGRDSNLLIDTPVHSAFGKEVFRNDGVKKVVSTQETPLDAQLEANRLNELANKEAKLDTRNQFLQLLNKDNNWVTFFVKSIIQDSTRKGYEEVLFPAGDTASQIEGHGTLEEYIKGREKYVKESEEKLNRIKDNRWTLRANDESGQRGDYDTQQEAERHLNDSSFIKEHFHVYNRVAEPEEIAHAQRTLDTFRKELEDARSGKSKLSAINSFYENTIQNILNKQKFSPERITDEYGNDWFKVPLKENYKETIFFDKQLSTPKEFSDAALDYLKGEGLIDNEGNIIVNGTKALSYEKIGKIRDEYYNKYGINPFVIQGNKVIVNTDAVVFNKDAEKIEKLQKDTTTLLERLKDNTGVEYEIIDSDKAKELLGGQYTTNINAFFAYGKVYMIDSKLSTSSAFHEYAHPFVIALSHHNPHLYVKILSELKKIPAFQELHRVISGAPEYAHLQGGEDTMDRLGRIAMLDDEMVVRAMTDVAEGNTRFLTGSSFWQKLWFGIKQMLRDIFGQKLTLDKLDNNTTLAQLVDVLLREKVDVTPDPDQYRESKTDYPLFNREIAAEMQDIDNHDVVKSIETFHRVSLDHLNKMRENHNYTALREVLKNQADGSILTDITKLLNLAKQKEDELEDNRRQLLNFAKGVVGARILGDKMKAHVVAMNNDKTIDEKDKLRTMRYYSFISNDWLQAFDQLREINKDDLPELGEEIAKASNNFRRINDVIAQAFKGGLVSTFREQLQDINDNIEKELRPEIEKTRALVAAGNTALQSRLDALEKMHAHGTFDDEKILKLLQGELGDTNWFSSVFESYTSSPDAIVGGFAAYLNKELIKVEAGIQEYGTNLGNELAPLYKQYGVDVSKPEELGKQLVFKDTAFTKDEQGNPKGHEVYTFLHEFAGGYQYDYQNLQHQIDAAKESGNKTETIRLQKEFDQLRKDYFHREYVDAVYNAKEFWNESDINRLAQQRRKDITDQLASYEAESGIKDLEQDDRDHIDQLLRELKTLSSTKNLDGTDKTGDDLAVAQAIQEYNKRMMQFREEMPMKGAFERDMQTAKDDLLDKGFAEGSPDYTAGLNAWLKSNIRIRLSEEFYSSRNAITDEISKIVNKLDQDEAKQLDVSRAWKEMFEQIKGFRDQDNQPVGTSLSADKVAATKGLQEKINRMIDELKRLSGLTGAEQERYSQLWGHMISGNALDASEAQEYTDLVNKKQINGLSKEDNARIRALFEELKQFQSKIPTEYYVQAFNQKLNEGGIQGEVNMLNSEAYLDAEAMDPLLDSIPDNKFTQWYLANHIKKVKWDPITSQQKLMYERLYIWNRIVPNDDNFKNALATNNYQALLSLKNPYIEIRPAAKYFFYRIKNEYRTKREVGKTIDNKGNWLPRTLEQGAKDGKYRNKEYYELRNSKDSRQQALYKILETYKKYHLKTQEDSARYGRLWYEIPRVRKEKIENLEALVTSPARTGKNIISWIGSKIGKSKPDAFDSSLASRKDLQNESKMYVATDLFGNEINSIPMKYMSKLDTDMVSLDIGRSVLKYALGLQINKALHDINPFAQALKQTLAQEGIKSINKVSSRNWGNKFMNIPVLDRNNKRLRTINNMIERDIEGIENHMELGLYGSKVAQHIMGVAAFGSLAMNLPAGIKNVVVAKLQNLTESVSKEFFSPIDLKEADQTFMKRFMPKLINDYNKFSGRSLETQMFELFDFVQGKFEEHAGESFSASYKKDIAKLKFTRSFQALGELQAQGQAGLAMMIKQLVPWTHDGEITMIKYIDAWELKNGAIQLRDGVDKKWGKDGAGFTSFKLKVHKINELMQGAYAKMNQAEASRYTSYKLFNFMRRYLVPGLVNRFSVNRNNVALGTQREGYYMTFFRMAWNLPKEGIKNWAHYSDKEKRNFYKTLTEVGYAVSLLALMSLMGYNGDDPDKNKKMKGNSWGFNMALYEIAMIKGELENFIPWPGLGANEILRMKDQPSIAFPLLNKYYKIISHLIDLIQQPFTDYDLIHYKRDTGIYKKGDLKLFADLMRVIGYSGATLHPDIALKNYMATTNRYN